MIGLLSILALVAYIAAGLYTHTYSYGLAVKDSSDRRGEPHPFRGRRGAAVHNGAANRP